MSSQGLRKTLPVPVRRTLRRGLRDARIAKARMWPVPLPSSALDCELARNEYGAYCVPRSAGHRPAVRAVLEARVYEPDTLRLIRDIPGDVVHAGTFFGDFLPAVASRDAGALVWAFEPNRESFRCAQVTVLLNALHNVSLVNAALSDHCGEATLVTSDRHGVPAGGGSHLLSRPMDGRHNEAISLTTVDEAVPDDRHVGVLELDVEGHEQPALAGALRTIERCRPVLILRDAACR